MFEPSKSVPNSVEICSKQGCSDYHTAKQKARLEGQQGLVNAYAAQVDVLWCALHVLAFSSAVVEGQKYSGDESSPGIAAMAIDGNIAEGSPICCARHLICRHPSPITMPVKRFSFSET